MSHSQAMATLALSFVLGATSACAYAVDAPCSEGACDVPDVVTVETPIVRCWVETPGLQVSELHCSYHPENAQPVRLEGADLVVQTALNNRSARMSESSDDLLVATVANEAFPVEVAVTLNYAKQDETVIGIDTLGRSTRVFGFGDAVSAQEAEVKEIFLPFDLWEVSLLNRYQRSITLRFRHGLPFEPAGHIAEADVDCYNFGFQTTRFVAVPKDAREIDAALRVDQDASAVTLTGPGRYLVDEQGKFSRARFRAAEKGHTTAVCWVEDGASKAYRLVCSAEAHPGLEAVTVDLRGADDDVAVLPLQGQATRELDQSAFPLELQVRTKLSDQIYGLSSIGDSGHRETLLIESPDAATPGAPVVGALPFDLLQVRIDGDASLQELGVEFQPYVMELGAPWLERFALQTARETMRDLQPGSEAEAILAVSPNEDSVPASVYVIDENGQRVDDEIVLHALRYTATSEGFASQALDAVLAD